MPVEIERKFLVASEAWRPLVGKSLKISNGLVLHANGKKLRVRITDDQASLTFKGARKGLAREEVELPLDLAQAHLLLAEHCEGMVLCKTRHLVPWGELTWEIDVYEAPLDGVVLAEVELPAADHPLTLPDWLGEEVTGNPAWQKINMMAAWAQKTKEAASRAALG